MSDIWGSESGDAEDSSVQQVLSGSNPDLFPTVLTEVTGITYSSAEMPEERMKIRPNDFPVVNPRLIFNRIPQ